MNKITLKKDLRQALFFNLSQKDYKIINFLLVALFRYSSIFPSRALIAKHTGISLRTIDRCLARLKDLEVIKTVRRFNSSSIYQVNRTLFEDAPSYWHVLPALKQHWKLQLKRLKHTALGLLLIINGNLSSQGRFNKEKYHDVMHHTMHYQLTKDVQIDHDLQYDHQYYLKNKEKTVETSSRSLEKATISLGLTEIGIAKCSVLADKAIDYALKQHTSYPSFKAFFNCAVEYSKTANLPLAWTNYYSYVNSHEVDLKPIFMVKPIVAQKEIVPFDNSFRLNQYREHRKEYYDQLIIDRPDLHEKALELQALGFDSFKNLLVPNTSQPIDMFEDGCPIVPTLNDDNVDYTLIIK